MNELFKLSITSDADKGTFVVANTILNKDLFFAEFNTFDQACDYLDNCFKKIGDGIDFNYYIKK